MVAADTQARVFISYSRVDLARAEQIRTALLAAGYDAFLDKHDIAPGEPWRERLGALIESAEKIVFLISADSMASTICDWEVNHAEMLGKTILPVVVRETSPDEIPQRLKRLNFVFMRDAAEHDQHIADLVEALNVDLEWEREKTRIGDLALGWDRAGQPIHLLLYADASIRVAENWRDARPASSPPPTELQLTYIARSRDRQVRRRRLTTAVAIVVALVTLAASVVAVFQRLEAIEERRVKLEQRDRALENQSRFLAGEAGKRMDEGDYATAMLFALAGLPDETLPPDDVQPLRPTISEAARALHSALQDNREMLVMRVSADPIEGVAFSTSDPTRIAIAGAGGLAQIRDAATGLVVASLEGHSRDVKSIEFSSDGARIVTGSADDTARVWDAATGQELALFSGHRSDAFGARFSADGSRVVSLSSRGGGVAEIWRSGDGVGIATVDTGDAAILSAEFSPAGRHLVVASEEGVALVGDFAGGGGGRRVLDPSPADFATLSADGEHVAIVPRDDFIVRVLEVETGRQVAALIGHGDIVRRAVFSPDGTRIVTASLDNTARIWDVATSTEVARLVGHESQLNAAAFSPDGAKVVTASADGTVRIWDARSNRRRTVRLEGARGPISDMAFDARGALLTAGLSGGDVAIWTPEDGLAARRLSASAGEIRDVAVCANGACVAALFANGSVSVWNAEDGAELTGGLALEGEPLGLALSFDGARIAAGSDIAVRVWEIATGRRLSHFTDHGAATLDLSFSPDGARLAAALSDGSTRLWDLDAGGETGVCALEVGARRIAFAPGGDRIACIAGNAVSIQDLAEPDTVPVRLQGHERTIEQAAFSADGRRIVTISRGERAPLRIWDAVNGGELARFDDVFETGAADGLALAAFSPGGDEVATLSLAGVLGRWRVFPSTQELVDAAKVAVPRCLTTKQQEDAFLSAASQSWCRRPSAGGER